jgi:hypothetical protein
MAKPAVIPVTSRGDNQEGGEEAGYSKDAFLAAPNETWYGVGDSERIMIHFP